VSALGIERDGDTITAVVTDQGTIKTNTVVCAAGAWSKEVGAWVDVDLPVEPLRRQILVTEPLPADLQELFPEDMPMTIDATSTFYFHREGPAILLGMAYKAETFGFKEDFTNEWEEDLYHAMEARCPALLDVGVAHRWSGYYEVSPDHNAMIGEAKNLSRFLYATGFSGHGFLQGPAVGEVLRDMYLGKTPAIDVSPMSAERFASGVGRAELNII
jgi:sarcosine oxidase subunit beta